MCCDRCNTPNVSNKLCKIVERRDQILDHFAAKPAFAGGSAFLGQESNKKDLSILNETNLINPPSSWRGRERRISLSWTLCSLLRVLHPFVGLPPRRNRVTTRRGNGFTTPWRVVRSVHNNYHVTEGGYPCDACGSAYRQFWLELSG